MNAELAATIVLGLIGSNLAVEIFKAWREDRKKKKEDKEKQENLITLEDIKPLLDGVKELLGEALDKRLRQWNRSTTRTEDAWNEIKALYGPYRALGGNGSREKRFKEAEKKPFTD